RVTAVAAVLTGETEDSAESHYREEPGIGARTRLGRHCATSPARRLPRKARTFCDISGRTATTASQVIPVPPPHARRTTPEFALAGHQHFSAVRAGKFMGRCVHRCTPSEYAPPGNKLPQDCSLLAYGGLTFV